MLCLTRRIGETILVGDQVAVTVTRVKGRQVGPGLFANRLDLGLMRRDCPLK